MAKNKHYVVVLPYEIDEAMFERLSVNPRSRTGCNLIRAYEKICVMNITSTTSPKRALANIIFRELGDNVNSKSIVKMLQPDVDKQVFEFFPADNRDGLLNFEEATILRDYELAEDIAEKRGGKPKMYYFDLQELKKRNKQ